MVQDSITLAISVMVESFPFIILGIVISVLIQVWLPDGFLMKYLPRYGVLRRACISLFGMFMPVCECGNIPLARGLIVEGFTVPESMVSPNDQYMAVERYDIWSGDIGDEEIQTVFIDTATGKTLRTLKGMQVRWQ